MELDYGVGSILNKLKQLKIDGNTMVFFSSDNGAATYAFADGMWPTPSLVEHAVFPLQLGVTQADVFHRAPILNV